MCDSRLAADISKHLHLPRPHLQFDNLRSLQMHWGVSEGLHGHWGQPPRGWHTSPGVSTVSRCCCDTVLHLLWAIVQCRACGSMPFRPAHPPHPAPAPASRRPGCSLRVTALGTQCWAPLRQ